MDEPIGLPIDGVLDLHPFHPRDVKTLVPDYLAACREHGILQVPTTRLCQRSRRARARGIPYALSPPA